MAKRKSKQNIKSESESSVEFDSISDDSPDESGSALEFSDTESFVNTDDDYNSQEVDQDNESELPSDFSELEEFSSDDSAMAPQDDSDDVSIAYSSSEDELDDKILHSDRLITHEQLRAWTQQVTANVDEKNQSLENSQMPHAHVSLSLLVDIMRHFIQWNFPGISDSSKPSTRQRFYELENPDSETIFYDLMFYRVCPLIQFHLLDSSSKKEKVKLRPLMKELLEKSIQYLSEQVKASSKLLYYLKVGLVSFMEMWLTFPKLWKSLVKALARLWCLPSNIDTNDQVKENLRKKFKKSSNKNESASDNDEEDSVSLLQQEEEIRMLAFLLLKRIAYYPKFKNLVAMTLKITFSTLRHSALITRSETRKRVVPFLVQSLSELWIIQQDQLPTAFATKNQADEYLASLRLRQQLLYQVGFPLLREMASAWTALLRKPSKENRSKCLSWQWLLMAKIWASFFSLTNHVLYQVLRLLKKARYEIENVSIKDVFPLRLLQYPFITLMMACLTYLDKHITWIPFQLHILHCLDLCLSKKPTSPLHYSLLQPNDPAPVLSLFIANHCVSLVCLVHDKLRKTAKSVQMPNLEDCMNVGDDVIGTRLYADQVIPACLSLLKRDIIRIADHICFPEISLMLIERLRQLMKSTRHKDLNLGLKEFVVVVQKHYDWLRNWRHSQVSDFSTSDFLSTEKSSTLPLNGLSFVNAAGFSLKKAPLFSLKIE